MGETGEWLELTVSAEPLLLQTVAALLVDWGAGGTLEGDGTIAAYFAPSRKGEVEGSLERLDSDLGGALRWAWRPRREEEWVDRWKEFYRPSRVSRRLAVCPRWEGWDPGDPGTRVIRMDPGRAFGTGTHETTRLCLRLLDDELSREVPESLLDVGCGSGILSIGARLLGVSRVVALDMDLLAAEATAENARHNGVAEGILPLCGELRALRGRHPFVVANILYQVLLGLGPEIARHLLPGGRLLLSGMLESELPSATRVYGALGFRENRRGVEGEWGALLLTQGSATT